MLKLFFIIEKGFVKVPINLSPISENIFPNVFGIKSITGLINFNNLLNPPKETLFNTPTNAALTP